MLVCVGTRDETELVGIRVSEHQNFTHKQRIFYVAPLREQSLRLSPLLVTLRIKREVSSIIDGRIVMENSNPLINVFTSFFNLQQRCHTYDNLILALEELLVLGEILSSILRKRSCPPLKSITPSWPSRYLNNPLGSVDQVQCINRRCLVGCLPTLRNHHAFGPRKTSVGCVLHLRGSNSMTCGIDGQNSLVVRQQN